MYNRWRLSGSIIKNFSTDEKGKKRRKVWLFDRLETNRTVCLWVCQTGRKISSDQRFPLSKGEICWAFSCNTGNTSITSLFKRKASPSPHVIQSLELSRDSWVYPCPESADSEKSSLCQFYSLANSPRLSIKCQLECSNMMLPRILEETTGEKCVYHLHAHAVSKGSDEVIPSFNQSQRLCSPS